MNNPKPAKVTPPHEILKREMDARGLTVKQFAKLAMLTEDTAKGLLNGSIPLDLYAPNLFQVFGISASFWVNLQKNYNEYKAAQ